MDISEYLNRKFASGQPRKCWRCDTPLSRGDATADHLRPKSRGGKNTPDNLRLCCWPCNNERGNRNLTPDEWAKATGKPPRKGRDFSELIEAIKRV